MTKVFDDVGVDPETVLVPLASHLRPMLLNAWNARRKAALTDNSLKIKRVLDNLQKKLDEVSTSTGVSPAISSTCYLVFLSHNFIGY